jgi:Raf kinase inhibitor-like YbhB/YbcL family protein
MARTITVEPTTVSLTSSAFDPREPIPKEYTADGRNVSPPPSCGGVPSGAGSLALICEDPDAPRGLFTHWVIFNLPPGLTDLGKAVPAEAGLPGGSTQGTNSFGKLGYRGPSPPPGKPHRYVFRLFALDTRLDLPPSTTRDQLLAAVTGHVLGRGELTGIYGRAA